MLELTIWIAVGFVSGSVPWAVLVSKLLASRDVRSVGDNNPGAFNAWIVGGWKAGILSSMLDIAKSLIPVYLAIRYLGQPTGVISQIGLTLVAMAPIVGHGWSPFLRFKGGKTLATSFGTWIAVTGGIAFPVGCVLLGLIHGVQKNHAITVTSCLVFFLVVFLPLQAQLFIGLIWISNLFILVWKHRSEYSEGIILRNWVLAKMRVLP